MNMVKPSVKLEGKKRNSSKDGPKIFDCGD